jgi:hypothetical protein
VKANCRDGAAMLPPPPPFVASRRPMSASVSDKNPGREVELDVSVLLYGENIAVDVVAAAVTTVVPGVFLDSVVAFLEQL